MNELWIVSVVFALTTTALLAWVGFNRPSWTRTYTTAVRYRFAVVAHIALYIVFLLVVYALLRRVAVAYEAVDPALRSSLMWLALVITACVRSVVPLSSRWRAWFHRMAGIPHQAGRFAKFLAETELEADEEIRTQAQAMLLSRGVDAEHDWLPLAQPMHRNLLKATQLFIQLRTWTDDSRYSGFAHEVKNELDHLRQRFDRLSFQVSRTLASIERLGELKRLFSERSAERPGTVGEDGDAASDRLDREFDDHLRRLAGDMIADACEDVSLFYREACMLAARGVMATEATRKGRDRAIARLGFKPRQREARSPFGVLLNAAVLLYVGLWIFFLILPAEAPTVGGAGAGEPQDPVSLGQRIAIITVNVLGALAIAIVPKRRWGFANAGLHQKTPVAFVVAAGTCAVLFAMLVNLAAGALLHGGWDGALRRLFEGAPYLHSAFLTAAAVAWLVQDHRWLGAKSARERHLRDAATFGSVWFVSSLMAQLILSGASMDAFMQWQTLAFATGGFVFGAVMGYAIPESVRDERLRRPGPAFALPLSDFDAGSLPPRASLPAARTPARIEPAGHHRAAA
ncbi:hypothetical protein BURC_01392 [Burkholderiaceae bacterium]|nr:hypothetical protein BURC_01392 [Burkholderiaceae bacterium]